MAKQKRMNKTAKKQQEEINKEIAQRAYFKARTEAWKALKAHRDIQVLSDLLGVSRTAVSDGLNNAVGSIDLLTKIDNYFKTRENLTDGNKKD